MNVFVLVVLGVVLLLEAWLYRRLAVLPRWGRGVRAGVGGLLGLGFVVLVLGFVVQEGELDPRRFRWLAWLGMTWISVFWYLLLGCAVVGLVCLALRLAGRQAWRERVLRGGSVVVLGGALAVTGYGLGEAAAPGITRFEVSSEQLPAAFDGMRVAVISDVHAGPVRDASFVRRVVEQVNAEAPDLVILAGDLIDGQVAQVGDVVLPFADLRAPLGVFGITGNHEFISGDPDGWLARWRAAGIRVLDNASVRLERGSDSVVLAGVNDEAAGRFGSTSLRFDPAAALARVDPAAFTLFAAHQPVAAQDPAVARAGVDLQVSGHTHAGQLWPFRYAVLLQQPVVEGLADVAGTPVLTSRGAGAWGPPVRVLAPPEIPIVTLHTR